MRLQFLSFFFLLVLALGLAHAQQITSNVSYAQANQTIQNATAYVNAVNESGYLIFYPHLTQAYLDLNASVQLLKKSATGAAVVRANLASTEALAEYNRISTYKQVSLAATIGLSVFFGLFLYYVMRPSKKR